MAEEMIDDVSWESEEAEDWESEEAIAEAEESEEDIGERARRRRQRRRYQPIQSLRRPRAIQGMTVQGPDGIRKFQFPAKIATAADTYRGLASQERGLQAAEERVAQLEAKFRKDAIISSAVPGAVSLILGGGLVVFGAFKANSDPGSSFLGKWAAQSSTQIASVVSASQLATTGARFLIGRQYNWGINLAADIFATAQLAAFAFGSLNTGTSTRKMRVVEAIEGDPREGDEGTLFLNRGDHKLYEAEVGENGARAFRIVNSGVD